MGIKNRSLWIREVLTGELGFAKRDDDGIGRAVIMETGKFQREIGTRQDGHEAKQECNDTGHDPLFMGEKVVREEGVEETFRSVHSFFSRMVAGLGMRGISLRGTR